MNDSIERVRSTLGILENSPRSSYQPLNHVSAAKEDSVLLNRIDNRQFESQFNEFQKVESKNSIAESISFNEEPRK